MRAWAKILVSFFRSSYRYTCYEALGIAENGLRFAFVADTENTIRKTKLENNKI